MLQTSLTHNLYLRVNSDWLSRICGGPLRGIVEGPEVVYKAFVNGAIIHIAPLRTN